MTLEDMLKTVIGWRCQACDQRDTPQRRADGTPVCEVGDADCESVMQLCDVVCEMMGRQEERAGG